MRKVLDSKTSIALISALSLFLVVGITGSLSIGLALALLAAFFTYQLMKQREAKRIQQLSEVWPEVIDHLIAGLYSGLSISESISGLAERGPEIIRVDFANFRNSLRQGSEFADAINQLKFKFSHHGSDQIFEALLLSRTLGGGELLNTLRTLGSFQREDLALSREISIKHGWIKNSAHISAAAPWLLLMVIGTQQGTAKAFASASGISILIAGVAMTLIAYIWMTKISKLPSTPRVFG